MYSKFQLVNLSGQSYKIYYRKFAQNLNTMRTLILSSQQWSVIVHYLFISIYFLSIVLICLKYMQIVFNDCGVTFIRKMLVKIYMFFCVMLEINIYFFVGFTITWGDVRRYIFIYIYIASKTNHVFSIGEQSHQRSQRKSRDISATVFQTYT